jgi:arylsulfatase A-like enzyme
VILIVLDTVRADRLGCYGYDRPTTPNIDELAKGATLYTNAICSAPWTNPTHASLFTGKDPFEHGAHRSEKKWGKRGINSKPLPKDHVTLAEMFAQEDYKTGAIVANEAHINRRWGFHRGFDGFSSKWRHAEFINHWAYSWMDTLTTDKFFLFLNYMDTHYPYNTEHAWDYLDEPAVKDDGKLLIELVKKSIRGECDETSDLATTVIDQYDTGLAHLDRKIGSLIRYLKRKGLYDDALIVLCSDHGELFGEHRMAGHGKVVYHKLIQKALIVKYPGQRTGRIDDTWVTSSDMPSIVLSSFPTETRDRYRLTFPNAPGNHPVISENYWPKPYSLSGAKIKKRFKKIETAYYEWPFKYIHASEGPCELYNLELDPEESRDIIEDNPEIAAEMARILEMYQTVRTRADEEAEQPVLTEEEIKKLKALGYIQD